MQRTVCIRNAVTLENVQCVKCGIGIGNGFSAAVRRFQHYLCGRLCMLLTAIVALVNVQEDVYKRQSLTCVLYAHYQNIFDEIFLSLDEKKFGRTPKSNIQRRIISFTDLFNAGKIQDGTEFVLEYDGVCHYAVAEYDHQDNECYMLLLDEKHQPYFNSKGEKIGYYKTSSQAGIDAINVYRKKNNIVARLETLNGPAYWKTKEGVTIKALIDSL